MNGTNRELLIVCIFISKSLIFSSSGGALKGELFLEDELVFWGYSSLFFATISDDNLIMKENKLDENLENIISVSVNPMGIWVLCKTYDCDIFSVFFLNHTADHIRKIVDVTSAYSISVSSNGELIAMIKSCYSIVNDSCYYIDIVNAHSGLSICSFGEGLVDRNAHLAWHPDGMSLAYSTKQRWIEVFGIARSTTQRITKGTCFDWSPNGEKMAICNEKSIFVFDLKSKKIQRLYRRHFWQSEYAGELYWYKKDNFICFNVFDGIDGYDYKIGLIDLDDFSINFFPSKTYRGGDQIYLE